MKLYGKADEVGKAIVKAFQTPENLPGVMAPMFLRVKGEIPCRSWSWSNQFLVAINGTSDARGFRQWGEAGRKVKKGAKAFRILGPCKRKVENEETGEEEWRIYGFKGIPVFRLEDTEGEPVSTGDPETDEWLDNLPLIEVARSWGLSVQAFSGEKTSYLGYYRHGETIAVGVKNLSTWAHEFIHAADDRNGTITKAPGQQFDNELVAELGGSILLTVLGFEHEADLGGCFQYIQRYAEKAKKDTVSACFELLERTCKAVNLILESEPEGSAKCAA